MTNIISMEEILKHDKANPLLLHTWELWINRKGFIIAKPSSKVAQKEIYTFPYEENKVILLYNSSKMAYAYTRDNVLVEFKKKYRLKLVPIEISAPYTLSLYENYESGNTLKIYSDGQCTKEVYLYDAVKTHGFITISNYRFILKVRDGIKTLYFDSRYSAVEFEFVFSSIEDYRILF